MTKTKPEIIPTARLELRQAAEALEVHKSSIIRWTTSGKLKCGIRKSNGRKYLLGSDLIKFWQAEY